VEDGDHQTVKSVLTHVFHSLPGKWHLPMDTNQLLPLAKEIKS
jgi:hypothetical protein